MFHNLVKHLELSTVLETSLTSYSHCIHREMCSLDTEPPINLHQQLPHNTMVNNCSLTSQEVTNSTMVYQISMFVSNNGIIMVNTLTELVTVSKRPNSNLVKSQDSPNLVSIPVNSTNISTSQVLPKMVYMFTVSAKILYLSNPLVH